MEDLNTAGHDAEQIAPSDTGGNAEIDEGEAGQSETAGAAGLSALQVDLRQGLVALGKKLTRLENDFQTKLLYDQSKDRTIDALHAELQDYREGLQFKHLRPLVNDVLNLYDDLNMLIGEFSEANPELAENTAVAGLLRSVGTICEDIEDTLSKYGFDLFEHPGQEVDRKFQRVQATIPTGDPALDRTIARRQRKGLQYETRIIRPEVVQVYRYVPPEDLAGDAEPAAGDTAE